MGAQVCACASLSSAKVNRSPIEELQLFKEYYVTNMMTKGAAGKKKGLKESFKDMGGGNDGNITREEMVKYLKKNAYPGDASALFDLLDVDNEGLVTTAEFAAITKEDFIKNGPLMAFKHFIMYNFGSVDGAFKKILKEHDDGDAKLEIEEFTRCLEALDYKGDPEIVFKCLDEDKDQELTLNEFRAAVGRICRADKESAAEVRKSARKNAKK
ncbi:unnamed protein product [Polarella glacialis]|uniref:EF-hand domain-containing protein n=1 Tax=Polarella glacialis TaxID=89957 RepID=A0A813EEP7_POLGL|nr:unnamed protein product [Polarella glacialis]